MTPRRIANTLLAVFVVVMLIAIIALLGAVFGLWDLRW